MKVRIGRQGPVLDKPVAFEIADEVIALDLKQYADESLVSSVTVKGRGKATMLVLTDRTQVHPAVATQYKIIVRRKGGFFAGGTKLLVEGAVQRSQFAANTTGELQIPLRLLGASDADLDQYIKKGKHLWFEVTVVRTSLKLPTPIRMVKSSETDVP